VFENLSFHLSALISIFIDYGSFGKVAARIQILRLLMMSGAISGRFEPRSLVNCLFFGSFYRNF